MKQILLLLLITPLLILTANANIRIYETQDAFEKVEGEICEVATDGCNNFFMNDGKITGGTEIYCENHTPKWTCAKYKDGVITTMGMTDQDETNIVGGDKDEHGCIGSAGYKWNENEKKCLRPWEKIELSENDEKFYKIIKEKLDIKYQNRVEKAVQNYKKKIEKYNLKNREKINKAIIEKLETKINEFLFKLPMDVKLSQKNKDIFFILILFKFELMKLNLDY